MQKLIVLGLLLCQLSSLLAQNEIAKRHNQSVQKCIAQKPKIGLEKDFEIYAWATQLQKHCAELKDNKNSEILSEIAEQRPTVAALSSLSLTCPSLQGKIKNHLDKMQKIYDTALVENTQSRQNTGTYSEETTITFDYASAVRLKIHINAIVNILAGDESILRIFKK
ncbi:MAG: hypothetical protein MUE85_18170 [Microscillaceae bacterium]|jgi:hypothetical protein|nr:hypothetical protein [Microscillaceae bacterium]